MRIGIVVATQKERAAFFEVFGRPTMKRLGKVNYDVAFWKIEPNKYVYLILGGLGEIAAANSTQYLIDIFQVDCIINYGVAGGLSEEHDAKKVGIVKNVIHYDFDITFESNYEIGEYPNMGIYLEPKQSTIPPFYTKELPRFVCASADKIVGKGQPKRKLREEFDADICEMEAAGVLITCNRNTIPCTLIKAISDGVDESSDEFDKNVNDASKECVKVIKRFFDKTR